MRDSTIWQVGPNDMRLTQQQLEAHLWEAANILRGPVDAADFKTYIFPLLFFKRVSDVWDGEYEEHFQASGGDHREYSLFPENHRFQIPTGALGGPLRSPLKIHISTTDTSSPPPQRERSAPANTCRSRMADT